MDERLRQSMVVDAGQEPRKVAGMFTLSALGHLVFFVLLMVMPTALPSSYRLAPVSISVDLVSLPAGEPAPAAPAAPEVVPEAPPRRRAGTAARGGPHPGTRTGAGAGARAGAGGTGTRSGESGRIAQEKDPEKRRGPKDRG